VADSCVIERSIFDEAKRFVNEATGLPMENMLMSATHSHSCGTMTAVGQSTPDPLYQRFVARRIADGVLRALNNLAPAKIGWGAGSVPQHVFNRRWRMKLGGIATSPLGVSTEQVKTNPGVKNPHLEQPAGPTDPQVWFLSVQTPDGRPIALYANYSLHYVGGVGAGHISADYYGAFADRIQEFLGADRLDPPFVGMMSNGTSGDINNIDFRGGQVKQPPYGQIRLVANDVAQEVARVCKTLTYHDWVPLAVAQKELKLGLRLPAADEVTKAQGVMKGSKLFPRMETMEQVYARETVLLSEYPSEASAPLQVLKIGELRVAAIPAEVFVEIGLTLKQRHPQSFTVSLANAYHGYLPTPEHHRLGGYETWRARSSCLEVEASTKIVEGLEELFERLKEVNE
jgi:neutral ceramidase